MFASAHQSGPSVGIFAPAGTSPLTAWRCDGHVGRSYHKPVKGFVMALKGSSSTKMQLPKSRSRGLGLTQNFLVVQLSLLREKSFMMELGVCDAEGTRRRLVFSTSFSQVHSTPLHAQVPLCCLERLCGRWCNVVFDLSELTLSLFRAREFRSLEHILIGANCRLRQIFTMREQPQVTFHMEDLVDCEPKASENDRGVVRKVNLSMGDSIPRAYAFPGGVEGGVETVLVNFAAAEMQSMMKSAEALRSPLRSGKSKEDNQFLSPKRRRRRTPLRAQHNVGERRVKSAEKVRRREGATPREDQTVPAPIVEPEFVTCENHPSPLSPDVVQCFDEHLQLERPPPPPAPIHSFVQTAPVRLNSADVVGSTESREFEQADAQMESPSPVHSEGHEDEAPENTDILGSESQDEEYFGQIRADVQTILWRALNKESENDFELSGSYPELGSATYKRWGGQDADGDTVLQGVPEDDEGHSADLLQVGTPQRSAECNLPSAVDRSSASDEVSADEDASIVDPEVLGLIGRAGEEQKDEKEWYQSVEEVVAEVEEEEHWVPERSTTDVLELEKQARAQLAELEKSFEEEFGNFSLSDTGYLFCKDSDAQQTEATPKSALGESSELDLLFDPVTACYYEPATGKYFKANNQQ